MPAPPASPGHGARSASGAVPRRSLLYKLSGFLTATFWLSYVVLAACVGLYFGLVPALLLRPISRSLYYSLSHAIVAAWCTLCLLLPERVNGVRVRISGQLPPPDTSVLLISNHKCDLDYFFVWALASRVGPLQPGHFNAVAKGALRKVPLFGWLFKLVGFLFLARSWEADRARMGAWAGAVLRHPRPMWLLLYPEGTRFTARAKERSDAVAREAGQAPLVGELLLPRTKGFVELVRAMSPRFPVVLDMTIAYIGTDGLPVPWTALGTSALLGLAAGRLPLSRVDVHCQLFPLPSLPPGDEQRAAWLQARWKAKEALLTHCKEKGRFPVPSQPGDEAPLPTPRAIAVSALFAAGVAMLLHLAVHSSAFRMYLLGSSTALAVFAYLDPVEW